MSDTNVSAVDTSVSQDQGHQNAPSGSPTEPTKETPSGGEKPTEGHGEEAKRKDRDGAKFAALARRQKELKAKETAIAEREAKLAVLAEAEKLLNENPLAFLEKSGLSYEKLTRDWILKQDAPEPTTDERVARIEAELEAERKKVLKAEEDRAYQARVSRVRDWASSVAEIVKAEPDVFEMFLANGDDAMEDVLKAADDYARETGEVPDPRKMAEAVEAALEKEVQEELTKLRGKKKLSSFFKEIEAPAGGEAGSEEDRASLIQRSASVASDVDRDEVPTRTVVTRTLTNARTLKPIGPTSSDEEDLSHEGIIERVLAKHATQQRERRS